MSTENKAATVQMVTLERKGKNGAPAVKRDFPITQARELLVLAGKSKIPTWSLKDDRYKFENNEINVIGSTKPDKGPVQ